MPRNHAAQPTSRTHFEQVPLDVVEKITKTTRSDAHRFHGVQFYNDPDALCRIVGGFIGEGLEHGSLAVLIVTPDHADRIDSCLRGRGIDVDVLKGRGQLVSLDARKTLELFMVDGMPNPSLFRREVGKILTHARRGRERCAIRAYGEMVDLLWKDSREAAAIRLETLWNQLGRTHEFDLLCGYSMGNFYKGATIDEIKRQHTHSVNGDGSATSLPAADSLRPSRISQPLG
jgi:hypothetical protein